MGDLPAERVTSARPFSQCGLDFAGPVWTKIGGATIQKRYIALFVCFATKAVHLELVSNLTKEPCIRALKRFSSRRGTPSKVFSDNGLNFISAKNELQMLPEILVSRDHESFVAYANKKGSEWITIHPPSSSFRWTLGS